MKQGRPSLYVITADGANPQPLAPLITVRDSAAWSPDDQAVAATGFDEKSPGLFVVPLNGSAPKRIYDKLCYLPAWSPDGRFILFGEYVRGAQMQLKAVTPDGKLFPLPDIRMTRTATRGFSSPYRFLPDGKGIVLLEQELRRPEFWAGESGNG